LNVPKIKYPIGNFSKTSFWFSIIIGIILIVIPIILSKFFANADWDFIKTSYLIIIPIIAGGIATKISTSYWQLNKERLSIKRDFLNDYDKAYKRRSTLGENFLYKIVEQYVVYEKDSDIIEFEEYSITDKRIDDITINQPTQAFLKLSDPDNEKPIKKFSDEYITIQNKIHETSFFANKLLSSYRLYCEKHENFEKKTKQLEDELNLVEDVLLRFMHSNTAQELLQSYKLFQQINDVITARLEEIELLMIDLRFKKLK